MFVLVVGEMFKLIIMWNLFGLSLVFINSIKNLSTMEAIYIIYWTLDLLNIWNLDKIVRMSPSDLLFQLVNNTTYSAASTN